MPTIKEQLKTIFVKLGYEEDKIHLEYPANESYGDYSSNIAMVLSKELGQNPMDTAKEIVTKLEADGSVSEIVGKINIAKPGFINFTLSNKVLLDTIDRINIQKNKFGNVVSSNPEKIIIEYSSPNTNKPLHIGHLRNNFTGMALGNILKSQGHDILFTEVVNDRGVHICKSMLAYQMWGEGDTPEKVGLKGDHFVGMYYVKYGQEEKVNPDLANQTQELLKKWEDGDEDTRRLWRQMNDWAEQGYSQTYKKIGSHFDFRDYESKIYDKGRDIIIKSLGEGKAEKMDNGAVAVDLSSYKLGGREDGFKILLRSDGTTVYMTQDLYLAVKRQQDHHPDKVFYVVGDDQVYHFKVLFKIFDIFGYGLKEGSLTHVPYAMVISSEGKFSSREGNAPSADTIISELEDMVKEQITKRELDIEHGELGERAEAIALSAVKFLLLSVDSKSTVTFDAKASLDFEGNTGPYLLYTYARLSSIYAKIESSGICNMNDLNYVPSDMERSILLSLSRFPEILSWSAHEMKPHYVAEYIYSLSAKINSWYANHSVVKADNETKMWRMNLVIASRHIICNGLRLLGIEPVDQM